MNQEQYNDMWNKFQLGQITRQEWVDFATDYFYNVVMQDNVVIQVMKNLKAR